MSDELLDPPGEVAELVPGIRSRATAALSRHIVNNGLVVMHQGTIYLFVGSTNCWGNLGKSEVQKQIVDLAGSENVSVNYLGGALPHVPYLQSSAREIGSIPVSVCMGTQRLMVSVQGSGLELRQCEDIVCVKDGIDRRVSGFCVMPCLYNVKALSWCPSATPRLHRFLGALFIDKTELRTIMWIVGMSLVDPGSTSRFVLLYGPTQTGKSHVVSAIDMMLVGCCGAVSTDQLVTDGRFTGMTDKTIQTIASNRVVTTGELRLHESKLNIHVMKEMTGHDTVSMPPIKVSTRCSVFSSSNYLPDPEAQPEWLSNSVARRAVVVPMDVDVLQLPKAQMPSSRSDCFEMVLMCVHEYLSNDVLPMSVRSVLMSIAGSKYHVIRDHLGVVVDSNATTQDILDANTCVCVNLGISQENLGESAFLRTPNSVVLIGGVRYIKDLRVLQKANGANV